MRARLMSGNLDRARALRQNATDVERKLWQKLHELNRHLGCKFRRQVPFQNYILDFAEHGAMIVIELDGSQHGLDENRQRDDVRDQLVAAEGYHVLRFWNRELNEDFDAVIERILRALRERSPYPKNAKHFSTSPQGGGDS